MKKVIFVPGMGGGKKDMLVIKKVLKGFEVLYFSYNTKLTEAFEEYARQLKDFIDEQKLEKNEKVSIVSVSAGGIVAYYYVKFMDENKVNKIVTICSPLNGSWIWRLFPNRKGVQQTKKNNFLLKKITKKKGEIKELNFWCWLDPLVPGTSGKGGNPRHTFFFQHWFIQFWPPLIHKIKNFLEEGL